jgi:hypothetical protein
VQHDLDTNPDNSLTSGLCLISWTRNPGLLIRRFRVQVPGGVQQKAANPLGWRPLTFRWVSLGVLDRSKADSTTATTFNIRKVHIHNEGHLIVEDGTTASRECYAARHSRPYQGRKEATRGRRMPETRSSGKRERPNPPTVMWDTPNRFALRYVALDECFYGGPPVFQSSVTLRNGHGLNLGTLSDDQPT